MKVVSISQEQALQRAGRAGRECNGVCFRAFSCEVRINFHFSFTLPYRANGFISKNFISQQYEKLNKSTIPEIRRCNLSAVTLNLLAMEKNPRSFDFIDKPDENVSMKHFFTIIGAEYIINASFLESKVAFYQ